MQFRLFHTMTNARNAMFFLFVMVDVAQIDIEICLKDVILTYVAHIRMSRD